MDLEFQRSLSQRQDFIDLMKHPEEGHQDTARYAGRNDSDNELERMRREEVGSTYDFQPIRLITATKSSSKSLRSQGVPVASVCSFEDSKISTNASIRVSICQFVSGKSYHFIFKFPRLRNQLV